ncbi:MAG: hypothetical protein LBQ84_08430, partial [Flavobacteriaceae bacterium]|nr:hypothetical protein [Flavobacteriaceae bacterium]
MEKELISHYDKIEYYFLKNNSHFTNEEIKFLKIFKRIAVNPNFLDIQILMIGKDNSDKEKLRSDKEWFDAMIDKQQDEFKNILNNF